MIAKNFILAASTAILFSLTIATVARGTSRQWSKWAALFSSLVHLVSAGWATFVVLYERAGEKLEWTINWFSFQDAPGFRIAFSLESWNTLMWLTLALLIFLEDYFLATSDDQDDASKQGHDIARYVLTVGAFLTLLSGNLLTALLGWTLLGFAVFLGIALTAMRRAEVSQFAFQSFVFGFFAELILVVGVFGLSIDFGNLSFDDVTAKIAGDGGPRVWSVALIVLGTMLRSFQLPFLNRARYVGGALRMSPVLLIAGHVIVSTALISKLYPIVANVTDLRMFAILPSLTCLFSAAFAISEEKFSSFLAWLSAYLCGSIFLLLLQEGYQAAQLTAISGSLALYLLASTKYTLPATLPFQRWLLGVGVFALIGVPGFAFAQARQWEYLSFIRLAQAGSVPTWMVLSAKVLSDLLMAIALWRVLRSPKQQATDSNLQIPWKTAIPLSALAIANLSGVLGARWFSGLFGALEVEVGGRSQWFDTLIVPPAGVADLSVRELMGSEADVISRILLAAVAILPAVLAITWFWRDKKSGEEFQARWAQVTARINIERFFEFLIWDIIARKTGSAVGKFSAFFDRKLFNDFLYQALLRPARKLGQLFEAFDYKVIDRILIDGFGQGIVILGRTLRLIQNGQVQFYIGFGLIIMMGILFRYGFHLGG